MKHLEILGKDSREASHVTEYGSHRLARKGQTVFPVRSRPYLVVPGGLSAIRTFDVFSSQVAYAPSVLGVGSGWPVIRPIRAKRARVLWGTKAGCGIRSAAVPVL